MLTNNKPTRKLISYPSLRVEFSGGVGKKEWSRKKRAKGRLKKPNMVK
jgi:hypothetical protein